MPKASRDELLKKLEKYRLFVIYSKFFVPTILEKFDPKILPGLSGFAYRKEKNRIEELSWRENPDGTYTYNTRFIPDIFLHPHFFPMRNGEPIRISSKL